MEKETIKEQPKWKRIAKGDRLPCWSFIRKMDGTVLPLTTIGGAFSGQAAYYLPVKDVIEIIKDFPKEEGEDERIRNWLISTLKSLNSTAVQIDGAYEMMLPAIAWLEKRGQTFTKKDINDAYLKGVCDAKHELEKQGEQKPANWFQELEDKLANATPQQLAEWKEKYFKEEPAEWSHIDENRINNICDFIQGHTNLADSAKEAAVVFLKSLKDRVQPQPKQEWSEEDRKMMRNIIDDIHCGTNFNPEVMHAANEREKWFKSICLRLQSRWKPSEEQLNGLKEAIEFLGCTKTRREQLQSLYGQLLKIREE